MTLGHEVPKGNPVDEYNNQAEQILLRALDGAGGTWERHKPKTNLSDLVTGFTNDNNKGE